VWSGRNLFLTSVEPSEEDNLLKYRHYNFKCRLSPYHKLDRLYDKGRKMEEISLTDHVKN